MLLVYSVKAPRWDIFLHQPIAASGFLSVTERSWWRVPFIGTSHAPPDLLPIRSCCDQSNASLSKFLLRVTPLVVVLSHVAHLDAEGGRISRVISQYAPLKDLEHNWALDTAYFGLHPICARHR
jgi:hypothetical protein